MLLKYFILDYELSFSTAFSIISKPEFNCSSVTNNGSKILITLL